MIFKLFYTLKTIPSSAFWFGLGFLGDGLSLAVGWLGFFISSLWLNCRILFSFSIYLNSCGNPTARNSSSAPPVWSGWFPRMQSFTGMSPWQDPAPQHKWEAGTHVTILTNEHPEIKRAESFSQTLLLCQQISQQNMTAHPDNFTLSSRNAICKNLMYLELF